MEFLAPTERKHYEFVDIFCPLEMDSCPSWEKANRVNLALRFNTKSQPGMCLTGSCLDFVEQFLICLFRRKKKELPKSPLDRCYSQKCFIISQHLWKYFCWVFLAAIQALTPWWKKCLQQEENRCAKSAKAQCVKGKGNSWQVCKYDAC